MKYLLPLLFWCSLALFSACNTPTEHATENEPESSNYEYSGNIEVYDSSFFDLVGRDTKMELLASGFTWSEGPLWVQEGGYLLFTDVPENVVYRWTEADSITEFLRPAGYTGERTDKREPGANGLILDQDGKLILCQHGNRMVVRMNSDLNNPQSLFDTIAYQFEGKKFNSPNDLVMDPQGRIYFTDPPYGLDEWDPKETDFQGIYRVDTDGTVTLLVDSLFRPNGIGLSPDHKIMYIGTSDVNSAKYYAYNLDVQGNVVSGKVLLDVTALAAEKKSGVPDGLTVHKSGTLFATGPEGVLVISPEGNILAALQTGNATANCTFNNDFSTLYITSDMNLLRLKMK